MTYPWSKTVFPIAIIFAIRMLGLFLLIPVFTLYAPKLWGATPTLIGLALGGYGLTQGFLQIPFGLLSDKIGRKPVITLGLLLFAVGSLVGALSESIYSMIVARTLQGTGAIGSVLIALLADLTEDKDRTKAMAVVGVTIGLSFSLAVLISPSLAHYKGLAGIFYFTLCLIALSLFLLHFIIPSPVTSEASALHTPSLALFKSVIKNQRLFHLNLGIFCQHLILTSTFFAVPLILNQHFTEAHITQQWHFYLPLLVCSFLIMVPLLMITEKKQATKAVVTYCILFIAIAQGILALLYSHWYIFYFMMFVYFIPFNILEAFLPSLVSKEAPIHSKGTAMGVYSTSQFLGIFLGGLLAGILYSFYYLKAIFIFNSFIACCWFVSERLRNKAK